MRSCRSVRKKNTSANFLHSSHHTFKKNKSSFSNLPLYNQLLNNLVQNDCPKIQEQKLALTYVHSFGSAVTFMCNKIEKDIASRKMYINKLITVGRVPHPSCKQRGSHNQMHQAHITSLFPVYLLCHPARKISLAGELIYGRQKVIPSRPVCCSRASSFAIAPSTHSLKALDTVFALRCNV